jgi:hypothetical protein
VKTLLFSEEKRSKKDFPSFAGWLGASLRNESFLVLFFKKEHACLPFFLVQDATP